MTIGGIRPRKSATSEQRHVTAPVAILAGAAAAPVRADPHTGPVVSSESHAHIEQRVQSWWDRPTDNSATLLAAVISALVLLLPVIIAWRQLRLSQQTLEAALAQSKGEEKVRTAEAKSRRAAEFQERIDQFFSTGTQAAIAIIYHHDRDVRLSEIRGVERVSWAECELALVPATHRPYIYEPKLTAIRDCFAEFIEGLSRLRYLREEGLLDPADMRHIVQPLLARFVDYDTPLFRNLRVYIHYCEAEAVLKLFEEYAVDIRPTFRRDLAALEAAIVRGDYGRCQASPWGPAEFRKSASRLLGPSSDAAG